MTERLLDIKGLTTVFTTSAGSVKAVDHLDIHINRGEILGLVGESGCGKTVAGLSIMRLVPSPPGKISAGSIMFKGTDLRELPEKKMRRIRGKEIAMIFQEPMTALNPVFKIGNQITEVIELHEDVSHAEARTRAIELLKIVAIPDPARRIDEYPHELSGGMRQRAMIAMSLACRPDLLIADEPTTALDVTIQAQILDLLLNLRDEFGLSILLITHDLGVIAETADRVAVMYAGRLVESATVRDLFANPLHPYTAGLLRSIPRIDALPGSAGSAASQSLAAGSGASQSEDAGPGASQSLAAGSAASQSEDAGPGASQSLAAGSEASKSHVAGLGESQSHAAGSSRRALPTIEGTVPSLTDLPPGCAFAPRCAYRVDQCSDSERLASMTEPEPGHSVRCIRNWKG